MGSTTATNPKSVRLDFEEFFNEELALHKSIFGDFYTVKGTSQLSKKYGSVAIAGMPEETAENEDAHGQEVQEGYDSEVSVRVFSEALNLSQLLLETDQSGLHTIEGYAQDLARKMTLHRDVRAMGEPFAKMWDTTKLYGDGKQGISLSHPRKDGGTAQANTFPDGKQRPLDYDNLIQIKDQFNSIVSNKGMPLNIGTNGNLVLMAGPALDEVGFQLTQCEKTPDITAGNLNYWKGKGLDLLINPYMSWVYAYMMGWTAVAKSSASNFYDSMWFLIDKSLAKKMFAFDELAAVNIETEYKKSNQQEFAYAWDKFGIGLKSWYPFVGSKGDNSVFAS